MSLGIEISMPTDQLRKRKLMLATPMYAGMCAGMFCRSVASLSALCTENHIALQLYFLFNESLITRARNYCADAFIRSDSTHLMFVDADIGFDPQDVLAMLAMAGDDTEYDVICGPYAKKCISWEKIKQAVDKGIADNDPNILEKFVGDFVFSPKADKQSFPIGAPVEILEAGTGFMMIKKSTFQRFAEKFPERMYKPDHVRSADFDGTREIMMYFQAEIEPVSRRYLSEDYLFCQDVQKFGGKIWLCPWMQLDHVGTYVFGGSLAHLASVGAHATADHGAIMKNREKQAHATAEQAQQRPPMQQLPKLGPVADPAPRKVMQAQLPKVPGVGPKKGENDGGSTAGA